MLRELIAELEARAKAALILAVRGIVHVDNTGMQEVLRRLGKPVAGLMFETPIAM